MKKTTVLILSLALPILLTAQRLTSGIYNETMLLYFDSAKQQVSGFFSAQGGWDAQTQKPRFDCSFFIRGKIDKGSGSIRAWHPSDPEWTFITGNILLQPSGTCQLQLNEDPGGCWNVQQFSAAPLDLELTAPHRWTGIAYIKRDSVPVFTDTINRKKISTYLPEYSGVGVLAIRGNWILIYYMDEHDKTGWIRRKDATLL